MKDRTKANCLENRTHCTHPFGPGLLHVRKLVPAALLMMLSQSHAGMMSIVTYNEFTGAATYDMNRYTLSGSGGYEFAGASLESMLSHPNFLGVEDGELRIADSSGSGEQYSYVSLIGVADISTQPLSGEPHNGENIVGNSGFVDMMDDGYYLVDADNTTSFYGVGGVLAADYSWTQFSGGGDLDGLNPAAGLGIAAEDGLWYNLSLDGTLEAYYTATGARIFDYWTWTHFSGGVLNGHSLTDALDPDGFTFQNEDGTEQTTVKFLGIGADQLVFSKFVETIPEPDTAEFMGISSASSTVMKLEVNSNNPELFYLKTAQELTTNTAWSVVGQSTNGLDPFIETNLSYSTASGSNIIIYVKADQDQKFFSLDKMQ
ncbi:hypothetical protein [Tichowtungia aerotolerans]|uniref:Uncharacterized protein n=1 Tax=Tichowtungia aerotolerans TaxID=2697043 RepID=A0A6P1M8J2_9BACT|nr:hypothetical protein [Tichowtungia aerotolerans]QHI69383.1 hypothetical protein GT409_07930 [Tichowtungia aerotolerans]